MKFLIDKSRINNYMFQSSKHEYINDEFILKIHFTNLDDIQNKIKSQINSFEIIHKYNIISECDKIIDIIFNPKFVPLILPLKNIIITYPRRPLIIITNDNCNDFNNIEICLYDLLYESKRNDRSITKEILEEIFTNNILEQYEQSKQSIKTPTNKIFTIRSKL